MKAWEDLKSSGYIKFYKTRNSEFYVNHGVKIERFDDGEIVVKNTMTNSDHYEDVPWEILELFKVSTFDHGAFAMCSHVYKRRAEKIQYNIDLAEKEQKYEVSDRLRESYHKVINKHYDYEDRISRLLSSL